jgi:hypothetical protein
LAFLLGGLCHLRGRLARMQSGQQSQPEGNVKDRERQAE